MYLHTYVGINNLRNVSVTANEITIVWNYAVSPSGCGPVLYYNVTAVNSANPSDMYIMKTRENVAILSDLGEGTSYIISVVAVNRAGTGPSSVINVTTLLPGNGKSKQYKYINMYIYNVYAITSTIHSY